MWILIWVLLSLTILNTALCDVTLVKLNNELRCISTNETSGLAWILKNDSTILPSAISSSWTAPNKESELQTLNCNVQKCEAWKFEWNVTNLELEYTEKFGPLLDHRWNTLPMYRSDGSYTYAQMLPLPEENNLQFHLSVLAKENAYIILSTGNDPHSDFVYWIIVDGWSNYTSAIRRCPSGVPKEGWPGGDCEILRNANIISGSVLKEAKEWAHLTITLERNEENKTRIILQQGNKVLIDWTDYETFDPVRFLSFRTQGMIGYWKLHQYEVFQSSPTHAISNLEHFKVSRAQSLCLSISYSTLHDNWIAVLYSVEENGTDRENHRVELKQGSGWQVARMEAELISDTYYIKIVSQRSYQSEEDTSTTSSDFYIGDIHVCGPEGSDSFVTLLNGEVTATCVALKTPQISITNKAVSIQQSACLGDTFGSKCELSCSHTLERTDCSGVASCTTSGCTCLSGYYHTGCLSVCSNTSGRYGPMCARECDNKCKYKNCDPHTGHCKNGCTDDIYVGDLCDEQLPIVKTSPRVTVQSPTSFSVLVWTSRNDSNLKATTYEIQIRERPQGEWQIADKDKLPPVNPHMIRGLNISTTYEVRTVLRVEDGRGYTGDKIPTVEATTTCTVVTAGDITYTSTQQKITIAQWNINDTSCKIRDYMVKISTLADPLTVSSKTVNQIPLFFNYLQSDTSYTLSIVYSSEQVATLTVKTQREDQPKLKKAPKLIPLAGGVSVNIEDKNTDTKPTYVNQVLIQYKVANAMQWQNGSRSAWPVTAALNMTGLHVLTSYHVRAVLLEIDDSGDTGDGVKIAEVTTDCQLVDGNEITITSHHFNSVTVNWPKDNISCPPSNYEYYANDGYKTVEEIPFTILKLMPETKYTVYIYYIKEGVYKKKYIKQLSVTTLRDRGPKLQNAATLERALVDGAVLTIWTIADRNDTNVASLFLQYKHDDKSAWHNGTKTDSWPVTNVTLQELQSNTHYRVRAILVEKNGDAFIGNDVDKIPELNFTTSCELIDKTKMVLTSGPHFITINWNITGTSCPFTFYDIKVNSKLYNCMNLPCIVDKLVTETQYTVEVFEKGTNNLLGFKYIATKRDRAPKLLQAPTLKESLVDGAKLEITQQVDRKNHNITSVFLQYKKVKDDAHEWHNDTKTDSWPVTIVTLQGLQSNTQYHVRAILVEKNGDAFIGNEMDMIPELNFTTSCNLIDEEKLTIKSTEMSIEISWQLHATSCPLEFYKYSNTKTGQHNNLQPVNEFSSPQIQISDLTSDTEYVFYFFNANKNNARLFEKTIRTQREPPPYFEEAPQVTDHLIDGFTLKLNSDKIKYSVTHCTGVKLQYKIKGKESWEDGETLAWPLQNSTLTLQGLKSDTTYEIRAVLLEPSRVQISDTLLSTTASTTCIIVDKNKVEIKKTSESIILDWSKSLSNQSCPIKKYKFDFIHENGELRSSTTSTSLPITFPGDADTEYTIRVIYHDMNRAIRLEGESILFSIAEKTEKSFPILLIMLTIFFLLMAAIVAVFWIRRRKYKRFSGNSQLIQNVNNYPRGAGVVIPSELDLIPLPERSGQERNIALRSRAVPTPTEDEVTTDLKAGASEILTHLIRLQELETYVEMSLASGELKRQHALFPRGQTQRWDYGRLPENKMKNRYGNLVAYDFTRVKLEILHGDPHSDYINANYLDGYKHPRAYIATQGPKPVTVNDFWRMIWQENVNLIVMLANVMENGKKKCEQYWPDFGKQVTHGAVTVNCVAEDIFADYTFRNFSVVHNDQKRKVLHFHFTTWPDHGVPNYPQSVASFLKKILTIKTTGPIVVHCSAGVGRTGTVVLADACLRMASAEGQMDPLSLLQTMRSQRPNMVDNAEQYELVHVVLLESLLTDAFNIPCSQFSTQLSQMLAEQRSILDRKFTRLNKLCQRDAARKNMRTDLPWPEEKSRFPEIAPGPIGRVILNNRAMGSEYINAVYVDGFRTKGQFIATQLPLPDTVTDLWHLVTQTSASIVIVLNQPDPSVDQTTCTFWPESGVNLELSDTSKLIWKQQSEKEIFEQISLQLQEQYKQDGEVVTDERDITLLVLKGWKSEDQVPTSTEDLLELWEQLERQMTGDAPIIITCYDGARACGLFLASVFVVEKMKLEKEVDVGLAVRSIRSTRPQFITSLDQFEFIHLVAQTYMDSYETYANFQ